MEVTATNSNDDSTNAAYPTNGRVVGELLYACPQLTGGACMPDGPRSLLHRRLSASCPAKPATMPVYQPDSLRLLPSATSLLGLPLAGDIGLRSVSVTRSATVDRNKKELSINFVGEPARRRMGEWGEQRGGWHQCTLPVAVSIPGLGIDHSSHQLPPLQIHQMISTPGRAAPTARPCTSGRW